MKDIEKQVEIAEKRIAELIEQGDIKKLPETDVFNISRFYEQKSRNRLESAKIIFEASRKTEGYTD